MWLRFAHLHGTSTANTPSLRSHKHTAIAVVCEPPLAKRKALSSFEYLVACICGAFKESFIFEKKKMSLRKPQFHSLRLALPQGYWQRFLMLVQISNSNFQFVHGMLPYQLFSHCIQFTFIYHPPLIEWHLCRRPIRDRSCNSFENPPLCNAKLDHFVWMGSFNADCDLRECRSWKDRVFFKRG